MPIIRGAASDITTLARANATQTTDPEKKSRTFVAPNKAVIAPIVRGSTFSMLPLSGSITFGYTGGPQRFAVHPQVTGIVVTLIGAGGGSHAGGSTWPGGNGGYVSGLLRVNAGESLDIVVGGGGGPQGVGGYGGGGTGWDTKSASGGTPITNAPGGGGGRTAIIRNGVDIVTAGGGGGAGRGSANGYGGAGGGLIGGSGVDGGRTTFGTGGTQIAGGTPSGPTTGLTGQAGIAGSQYKGGNGESGAFPVTSIASTGSGTTVTYTGTFTPMGTIGQTLDNFSITVAGATTAAYNGSFKLVSWSTTAVVVTSTATGASSTATLYGMNDDTGGGGGGWFGGGGGACDGVGNYGGGGGGGSSYVALLATSQPIINTQGAGAAGGATDGTLQKSGGNGSCIIQYTVDPNLRNWKSPPFNGRIYIT